MSTLFISHSSSDNDASAELARRLAERKLASVFLDFDPEKGIVGGQSWERTLYRKLRACRAVIAVCTEHYLASQWCFAELALARMEGKLILALLVDPLGSDARLPTILGENQYIDLRTDREQGYQRLWLALETVDLGGGYDEWNPKVSPYLGLNAYDERDAPVFFGRDDETRAGIELLERGAPGLVMVLGASGSGKSSVVRAGIVPRLRKSSGRWLVVGPFRPRRDPFAELAEAFVEAFERHAPGQARATWTRDGIRALRAAGTASGALPDALVEGAAIESGSSADERLTRLLAHLEDLRRNPPAGNVPGVTEFLDWSLEDLRRICGGPPAEPVPVPVADGTSAGTEPLADLADQLRRVSGQTDARVLVVIDQFEELLGPGLQSVHAARFMAVLRAGVEAEFSPLMVLGTMRSDFLGAFQHSASLRGVDFVSLSVGPISPQGMRRAIEEPARLGAIELEQGLADRLLRDAETPDALPLLSFTLSVLWRDGHGDGRLDVREYEQLGGLQGAIAREADAVLDLERRKGHEDALRRAFLKMARLTEDGAYARQPVSWDDADIVRVQEPLKEFERRRLLVTRTEKNELHTLEVAHEALFRSWAPLKAWLDGYRSELLLAAQLRRDAMAWEDNQRSTDTLWRGGRLQQAEELLRKDGRARREGAARTEWRFVRAGVRRRRWTRGVLGALTVMVIGVLSALLLMARRAEDSAVRMAEEATAQRVVGDGSDMLTGRRNDGTLRGMLAVLAGHRIAQELHSPAAAAAAYGALQRAYADLQSLRLIVPDTYEEAAFSADGTRLHLLDRKGVSGVSIEPGSSFGKGTDPAVAFTLNDCDQPRYSPMHDRVVCERSGSNRGSIELRLLDPRSGKAVGERLLGHGAVVRTVAFSPDGARFVSGDQEGGLRLWDAQAGKPIGAAMPGHRDGILGAMFSPDGQRVATSSWDGTVRVWHGVTGEPLGAPLEPGQGRLFAIGFGPGLIAAGSERGTVSLWDAGSGRSLGQPLRGHADGVTALAFSPDGSLLASGGGDGTLILWDMASGEMIGAPLKGHHGAIRMIRFSPDGTRLLSRRWDGSVLLWDARTGPLPGSPLNRYAGQARGLAFSPDGKQMVSGGQGGSLQLWDIGTREAYNLKSKGSGGDMGAIAFSPAGDQFVVAGVDGSFQRWDARSRRPIGAPVKAHSKRTTVLAYDKQGRRLMSASADGTLRLWDAGSQQPLAGTLTVAPGGVTSAAFGGDGNLVIVGGQDGRVTAWDAVLGRQIGEAIECRHCTDGGIDSIALSPDGRRLVVAGGDQLALLDRATGAYIGKPRTHGPIFGLRAAFSPDGTLFATHDSESARLWDGRTGAPVGQAMKMRGGGYITVAFAPDGRHLAVSSAYELRLQPIAGMWADTLCAAVPRNLGHAEWREVVSADLAYAEQCPGKPVPQD